MRTRQIPISLATALVPCLITHALAQDAAPLVKSDTAPATAAQSWPFKGTPEDLDRAQLAKREAALARARERAVRIPMTPAATPNYFMYWGVPFPMTLDTTRIAVQLSDAVPDAQLRDMALAAAQSRGIATAPGSPKKDKRFVVITLAAPLADAAAINAAIDNLTQSPAVAFAAPVFLSDTIPGGFAYPTASVLARVKPEFENNHIATFDRAATGLAVEWNTLGTLQGAARLRSDSKNGFDVMAQANTLAANPAVKWAEPSFVGCARGEIIVPNDTSFGSWWQHHNTSGYNMLSDWAWTYYGFGSPDSRVLILDCGVEAGHPDLNQVAGRDFTNNLPGGSAGGGPDYSCDDHGTAVAGFVSEIINNNVGGAGICPECISISGKVAYDDDSGACQPGWSWAADSTISAIAWGVGQNIHMTNSSWEAWPHSPGVEDQLQNAAVNYDVSNYAATGNDSLNGIAWPSMAPYVYAVGACDSTGARASFSNYGSGLDFTAPGVNVASTDRTGYSGYANGNYMSGNGTSFASPLTAGLAAYLKSLYPFANRSQIFAMMRDSCTDAGSAGYDTVYGYGRVNAYGSASLYTPSNDICSSAPLIIGWGAYEQIIDTTWSTATLNEPRASCDANAAGESSSVFYQYLSTDTGYLDLSTVGTTYDTVLSVFTGCGSISASGNPNQFSNPLELACNDDISGSNVQSHISNLWLDDGQLVLIKVSKWGTAGGGGTIDFNLAFTPAPPPNDLCSGATVINLAATGSFYNPATYSVERATRSACDGSETCGSVGNNAHSVWYQFVPPVDGVVSIDTSGSNYDTVLHLYQANGSFVCPGSLNGQCIFGPSLVSCDDDSGPGTNAKLVNIGVTAGQTYKIKVSGYNTAWGRLDFNFTYAPISAPANDACANAVPLLTTLGEHSMNDVVTNRATTGLCDGINPCGDPAGDSNSIWYKITPTQDILFTFSTQGSNYDTVVNIYHGNCTLQSGLSCSRPPSSIACNDNISASDHDSLIQQVPMTAGQNYLIKVADRDSTDEGGNTHMTYIIEAPPPAGCDSIDFNGDGLFPDTQDIADFIAVFGGSPCPTGAGQCGDIDFNNDGLFPDTDDITAFINVFGGGNCP